MALCVVACWLIGGLLAPPAAPARNPELAAAQARWAGRSFSRYRLALQEGDTCYQSAEVWDERVVGVPQHTCLHRVRTIANLFKLIERDRTVEPHCTARSCACDSALFVRATYDARLGYPREVTMQVVTKAGWRRIDYWRELLVTGRPPRCAATSSRSITVLSVTPLP